MQAWTDADPIHWNAWRLKPPPEQWQALEGERDRLRLLLEVSESIASHRDVGALLHDLAQRLPRIVPFDVVNIVLHDPVRNSMRLHALVAPEFNKTRPGLEFSMDETTSKFVWENQQPVMVEDVEAEKSFPRLMARVARERRAILLHRSVDHAAAPAGRHVIRQRAKANLQRIGDRLLAASGPAGRRRRGQRLARRERASGAASSLRANATACVCCWKSTTPSSRT